MEKDRRKLEIAKKEGKSKEEKLADGKRKKQRIREEMPQYVYLAFTAFRIPSLAIGTVTRKIQTDERITA